MVMVLCSFRPLDGSLHVFNMKLHSNSQETIMAICNAAVKGTKYIILMSKFILKKSSF